MKDTFEAIGVEPPFEIFAREYCIMIDDHPKLKYLQENHFDAIRDLNKIITSDVAIRNRIEFNQICLVETLATHVQSCFENSIMPPTFTAEDVLGTSGRDENWHKAEMQKLADFVIQMLDNTDDVVEYLADESVVGEYKPLDLMPLIE